MEENLSYNEIIRRAGNNEIKSLNFNGKEDFLLPGWILGDESDADFIKIHPSGIGGFLRSLKIPGLKSQILYDIFELGINSEKDRPRCPFCGKPAKYYMYSYGYYTTCGDQQCKNQRVSDSNLGDGNPNFGKKMSRENREKLSQKAILEHERNSYDTSGISGNLSLSKCPDYHYDSSWEKEFALFCENNDVIKRFERPGVISYEFDGINRKYIPDFLLVLEDKQVLIEIKPKFKLKETHPDYLKTQTKISTAKIFCEENGIQSFLILTEDDLFENGNYKKKKLREDHLILKINQ